MEVKLKQLKIDNFQGINSLRLVPEGDDLFIYGANESGKTTIFNAYSWLILDQDSEGNKRFKILPENAAPVELKKGMAAKVEGIFTVTNEDGEQEELRLKRTMNQDWQENGLDYVRQGNQYDYYVNKSNVQKSDYMGTISKYFGEQIELLTNAYQFPGLHWEERRKLLLDMIDTPKIWEQEAFKELAEYVDKPDQIRQVGKDFQSKKREIKDKLEELKVRLEEHQVDESFNIDAARARIETIEQEIKAKDKELEQAISQKGSMQADSEKARMLESIQRIKNEIIKIEGRHEQKIEEKASDLNFAIRKKDKEIQNYKDSMEAAKEKLKELKADWKKWKEADNTTCPECGQELPEEQKEEALNKKAEKLKEIEQEGQKYSKEFEEYREKVQEGKEEITELQDKFNEVKNTPEPDELKELREKKQQLIEKMEDTDEEIDTEQLDKKIAKLRARLEELREEKSDLVGRIKDIERIEELQSEVQELQEEYEKYSYLADLAANAAVKQDELLQKEVNELFNLAEIDMFSYTQKGKANPACTIKYKGVEYDNGLNYGHRILIGLDIIKTLSDYYNCVLPVFIDNAESITENVSAPGQLICLIATPNQHIKNADNEQKANAVRENDKELLIIKGGKK